MASLRDVAGRDALSMLAPAGAVLDGASGFGDGADDLAFDLLDTRRQDRSAMLAGQPSHQEPSYMAGSRAAEDDYLDQLAFDGLLASDEDGTFDLFGSPIPSGSASLAPFDAPASNLEASRSSSLIRYDAQGPPSSSGSTRRSSSGSRRSSHDGQSRRSPLLPPTDAFTINPSALSMNPSAMHFIARTAPAHELARPSSSPGASSSSRELSPVRRSTSVSPRQHVNAVAGPGPSTAAHRRAPVGVVDLSAGSTVETKRARSTTSLGSRSQTGSRSPTKLPSPPAKRKKLSLPAQPPPAAPRIAQGSRRPRSVSPGANGGPALKRSKGEETPAASLNERITKAQLLNAIKAKLRTIAELYDDDRRLMFHLQHFKLLADYDPIAAREDSSTVFVRWAENYDLAKLLPAELLDDRPPKLGDSSRWKTSSSRRAMAQKDAMQTIFEPVPVPSAPSEARPAAVKPSAPPSSLGPPPPKKVVTARKASKKKADQKVVGQPAPPTTMPFTGESDAPAKRRPSAPIHRHERPLAQPKSGMPAAGSKPWHSTKPPPVVQPASKQKPPAPKKRPRSPTPEEPEFVHRADGDVPLGAAWGGSLVWNPAVPREAFCILDDDDLIETDDEETKREKEDMRIEFAARKERERRAEEEREAKKAAATAKRAPPPKTSASKLSQLVERKKGDLQAQRDKDAAALQKRKPAPVPASAGVSLSSTVRPTKVTGPSRLPPPQHVSRLPPPQVSHRSKFQHITKHTAYSDSDSSADDVAGSRRPAPKAPVVRRSKAKFVHLSSDDGNGAPAKVSQTSKPATTSRPPEVINVDSDSDDDSRGDGLSYDPPSLAPPPPLLLLPDQRAPACSSARPSVGGKSPAAAFASATVSVAQPVRLKLNLHGKAIASFTSSLSSTSPASSAVWDREPPIVSPPLSPIITAANLPPHEAVAYPRYTDEAQLRDYLAEEQPTLGEFLEGLQTNVSPAVDLDVIGVEADDVEVDGDDVDDSTAAIRYEASVKEKVALARSFGRLDAGGLELQTEHEEREELFVDEQIAFLPRSGGFLTQHDHFLDDVHRSQRSIISLSKNRRRTATRIAEMIEEFWAKKEGRDAKSLKEQEKARKAGARKLAKEIRAKWSLAVDLVHTKHRAAEDEEERRRNKEELSELLERSQALLADRRADLARPSASPDPSLEHDSADAASEADSEDEMERQLRLFLSPPPASPSVADETPVRPEPEPSPTSEPAVQRPVSRPAIEPIVIGDSSDEDNVQFVGSDSDDDEVQVISPPRGTLVDVGGDGTIRSGPVATPPHSTTATATVKLEKNTAIVAVSKSTGVGSSHLASSIGGVREAEPDVALIRIQDVAVPAVKAEVASPDQSTATSSSDDAPPRSESEHADATTSADAEAGRTPRIPKPSLLRGDLRPYQEDGLDWLVSLYNNGTNGILADEMGLGKTIQTIALLAHLACEKGLWGPHLIIVPTSVLLNWDMEFKKFLPGFNVLPYYGSKKERDAMRRGWDAEGAFEVCITSYQLAVTDAKVFKRKQWGYMVLDEAHNIKNFKSKKWSTLLGFNAERRLLLTGTPLQNNLQELWSLLYFLMPNEAELDGTAFANHKTFNEWFSTPLERAIEAGDVTDSGSKGVVDKLHMILRPYVLRRLKSEVEKGLPAKREHVVYCRLSKRQRFLYDEFMSRAETREKLSSNNVLTISNCLMKLRKVCNHPDLFETRPIRTSFVLLDRAAAADYEIQELFIRRRLVLREARATVDLSRFDLHPSASLGPRNAGISVLRQRSMPRSATAKLDASEQIEGMVAAPEHMPPVDVRTIAGWKAHEEARKQSAAALACRLLAPFNNYKCQSEATVCLQPLALVQQLGPGSKLTPSDNLSDGAGTAWPAAGNLVQAAVLSYATRAAQNAEVIQQFAVIPPMAVAPDVTRLALAGLNPVHPALAEPTFDSLHQSAVAHQIAFPDASLIQYDCGKLQTLYDMFRKLKAGGHRALVFTQMARVLDILEIFLNLHGYRYLRLDGSTKVEDRQVLMESFNADDKIFCFIATTRSGGVGLNLTGADTVIMYDSDWNPAMDKQAQDRAHRIGQKREVNVYRLVSSHTVEENMLKKANQKRQLDDLVMQDGDFTTDFLSKIDWHDALKEFAEEALAAEPAPASADLRSAQASVWDADDPEEDEEMRALAGTAKAASHFGEDDFEGDGEASSQRHRSAGPVGEDEEDGDDGLEGVERLMVRWVEADWDYFG